MNRIDMIIKEYSTPFIMSSSERVEFMSVGEILKKMGHE